MLEDSDFRWVVHHVTEEVVRSLPTLRVLLRELSPVNQESVFMWILFHWPAQYHSRNSCSAILEGGFHHDISFHMAWQTSPVSTDVPEDSRGNRQGAVGTMVPSRHAHRAVAGKKIMRPFMKALRSKSASWYRGRCLRTSRIHWN